MATSTPINAYPINYPEPFCQRGVPNRLKDFFINPSTCFEAKDPTPKEDLRSHTLYAEGVAKIIHDVYPEEVHDLSSAIHPYDEPLGPIPVGASVFYNVMMALIATFYFTYLGRKFLANLKQKLDLHPEVTRFPSLPLYWIQQSKREADLRREVRNTWAWLARRYLLSPNDPLLDNVDQVLGLVNWHDFEVSRTTWSLIKVILAGNALYVKVKRDRQEEKGRKTFEITKDISLAKNKSKEFDRIQLTRVFEEGQDVMDGNVEGDSTKPRERQLKFAPDVTKKRSKESSEQKISDAPLFQTQRKTSAASPSSNETAANAASLNAPSGVSEGGLPSPAASRKSVSAIPSPVPSPKKIARKPSPRHLPPKRKKTGSTGTKDKGLAAGLGEARPQETEKDTVEEKMEPGADTVEEKEEAEITQAENATGMASAQDLTSPTEEEMMTTDQLDTTTGGEEDENYGSGDKSHARRKRRRRRRRKKKMDGERRWLYFYKKKGER